MGISPISTARDRAESLFGDTIADTIYIPYAYIDRILQCAHTLRSILIKNQRYPTVKKDMVFLLFRFPKWIDGHELCAHGPGNNGTE